MDFSNRNSQAAPSGPAPVSGALERKQQHKAKDVGGQKTWFRIGVSAAVLAAISLLVGVIVLISTTNNNSTQASETKYVYNNKLQAVFLNTGQVYFGNIKSLNSKYTVLTNIYYLQTSSSNGSSSSSSSSSNVTLVKLGCELHMPYDQMVINNNQITFWENLQDNGQVAKAVATFQKENPNGQKCADQSSSSGNTSSNVQNSSSNSSGSGSSSSSGH